MSKRATRCKRAIVPHIACKRHNKSTVQKMYELHTLDMELAWSWRNNSIWTWLCSYIHVRVPIHTHTCSHKLLQMQESNHVLIQLRTPSPPYVPYDAPMLHACKQVLNTCPTQTMSTAVLLLSLGQSRSSDKWPCHMEAPFVCTIHGANLIIHIISLAPFGRFAIPN